MSTPKPPTLDYLSRDPDAAQPSFVRSLVLGLPQTLAMALYAAHQWDVSAPRFVYLLFLPAWGLGLVTSTISVITYRRNRKAGKRPWYEQVTVATAAIFLFINVGALLLVLAAIFLS